MTQQLKNLSIVRQYGLTLICMAMFAAAPVTLNAQQEIAAETTSEATTEERGLEDVWDTFRPSGMDASFEMPRKPKLRERSFSPVAGEPPIKVRLYSSVIQNGTMMFVAGWHDLHSIPRNDRQRKDILQGAIATAVANVLGSVIKKEKVKLEKFPGLQVSYRFVSRGVLYRAIERVYLVGARQYQFRMLAKIEKYDGIAADRFFDSVQLLDPDNDLPPRPRNRKLK